MLRSQSPTMSHCGNGASTRKVAEIRDVVIHCTYKVQDELLRALDILNFPMSLDP